MRRVELDRKELPTRHCCVIPHGHWQELKTEVGTTRTVFLHSNISTRSLPFLLSLLSLTVCSRPFLAKSSHPNLLVQQRSLSTFWSNYAFHAPLRSRGPALLLTGVLLLALISTGEIFKAFTAQPDAVRVRRRDAAIAAVDVQLK